MRLERDIEDGDAWVCIQCGARQYAQPFVALDIPGRELLDVKELRKREPKTGGMKI